MTLDEQIAYWRKGHEIVEERLAKAVRADHADAPFPFDEAQAALWHRAQAEAYRDALEMMGVPEVAQGKETSPLKEALANLLAALSPLKVCGRPLHTLDTNLSKAIERAVSIVG